MDHVAGGWMVAHAGPGWEDKAGKRKKKKNTQKKQQCGFPGSEPGTLSGSKGDWEPWGSHGPVPGLGHSPAERS